ncbi:hypothetical protein [Nocardia sp. NPDC004750]
MIQQFVPSKPPRAVHEYPIVQQQQVACLDYIIGNMDRHRYNYRTVEGDQFIDIVAIDHGRSFPQSQRPLEAPIRSPFVETHRGLLLEPDVLDSVNKVDTGSLLLAIQDAGLHPYAIDGALARLEMIRRRGQIPAEVRIVDPIYGI